MQAPNKFSNSTVKLQKEFILYFSTETKLYPKGFPQIQVKPPSGSSQKIELRKGYFFLGKTRDLVREEGETDIYIERGGISRPEWDPILVLFVFLGFLWPDSCLGKYTELFPIIYLLSRQHDWSARCASDLELSRTGGSPLLYTLVPPSVFSWELTWEKIELF